MNDKLGAAAVLEAALQVALDGIERAKANKDRSALLAYYDVLSNAYNVAETIDYTMPNDVLRSIDPEALIGMKARNAA